MNLDVEIVIIVTEQVIQYSSKWNYNDKLNEKEMEEPLYPKIYFKEMYTTYPTLTYNQTVLSLVEKLTLKKLIII